MFLEAQSAHTRCKKEMLFKQWSERVFEPLQSALRANHECNGDYIDAQRRQIFDKYLSMTNKTVSCLAINITIIVVLKHCQLSFSFILLYPRPAVCTHTCTLLKLSVIIYSMIE